MPCLMPQIKPLRPLIPFDSFIPNSNEKLLHDRAYLHANN
jgi:hypothetical protein